MKLTDSIISEDERWGPVMKTMLRQKDRERHVARCKEKAPLIARIEKRVLCWPKHHSNTVATLAVGLHSVKSKVL